MGSSSVILNSVTNSDIRRTAHARPRCRPVALSPSAVPRVLRARAQSGERTRARYGWQLAWVCVCRHRQCQGSFIRANSRVCSDCLLLDGLEDAREVEVRGRQVVALHLETTLFQGRHHIRLGVQVGTCRLGGARGE